MEAEIKKQLIKSVDSIKNKIKMIQNEEDEANLKFKKVFKPITDNLQTIINPNDKDKPSLNVSIDMRNKDHEADISSCLNNERYKDVGANSNESSEYYDYTDNDDDRSPFKREHNKLISNEMNELINTYNTTMNVPFGIRRKNDKFMMGNSEVKFTCINNASNSDKNYVVDIGNRHYELTPGLKELLLSNKPDLDVVNEKDKITYKDMLHHTNAHKRNFSPRGQIKGDKGLKYRKIIQPLFFLPNNDKNIKSGGYIPKNKKYKNNTDYVFWDDPNELIERLKLLIASQNAGNTNHDNEILSIIEELQEAGIISE